MQNEEIIIKQADKGKAVVVQNRSDYLKEGFRQLSDNRFYIKLDCNPTSRYMCNSPGCGRSCTTCIKYPSMKCSHNNKSFCNVHVYLST